MSKQIYLKLDDIPIHRNFSQGHESDTVLDCPTLIPLNTFISKDKTFVGRWVPILYERYPCHRQQLLQVESDNDFGGWLLPFWP